MNFSDAVLPFLLSFTALCCLWQRADLYSHLIDGARQGLSALQGVFPALVCLLPAISMLRASGALGWLSALLAPFLERLGIPAEVLPLLLIRPLSGSGALAVTEDLIAAYGPDSQVGRTAAVMMGSTETTFYTVAVYFGAAGIRNTRHAIPAALIADLTGFWAASLAVRLFFGG